MPKILKHLTYRSKIDESYHTVCSAHARKFLSFALNIFFQHFFSTFFFSTFSAGCALELGPIENLSRGILTKGNVTLYAHYSLLQLSGKCH